jgi:ribosomal protein S18 acetylase RimI-like enzyme
VGGIALSAPTPLTATQDFSDFCCGIASLDDWLRRRALANQIRGASRSYVVLTGQQKVVGYYCLASGALALNNAPSPVRRNMPDPIPMVILGRLAVDRNWQGRGLGAAMLQDAVLRTMQAAQILGIRGMLVHAISDSAKKFYERYGFVASAVNPNMLILSLKQEI